MGWPLANPFGSQRCSLSAFLSEYEHNKPPKTRPFTGHVRLVGLAYQRENSIASLATVAERTPSIAGAEA